MSKYDEVLKPFVSLMERELHANSGKGDRPGWLSMSAYDCMLEIYYHAAKLQKAIKDGNGDGIAEYSADVANMAMMVADICGAIHLAAPVVERQDIQVAAMPVERCYDVRVKMIMAFNEAKKNDGDLDDALDAAYKSALRFSPNPLIAEHPAPVTVVVPEGYMIVERSIWTEEQAESAAKCITMLKNVPGMTDRDLALAAMDAGQCHAPEITLADFACLDKVKELNQ